MRKPKIKSSDYTQRQAAAYAEPLGGESAHAPHALDREQRLRTLRERRLRAAIETARPVRSSRNDATVAAVETAKARAEAAMAHGVDSAPRMTSREKVGALGAAFAGVGLIIGVAAAVFSH